ncbi:uncharacterized protein SOCE26_002560 [Sorangium cellulosum]|uniref:Secreted protein n=1 Tax=Sorangium cellulosum TaxID=56 RepID=A0A2L0EHW7_SORCE|nr:hypothetical protein [Sorangium cellulosum]AUX38876.1 uncharacterized protein SOCE26_002560 [Sorangium cellulosum]
MSRRIGLAGLIALLAATAPALGAPPEDGTAQGAATATSRPTVVLVPMKLAGSTDGKGTAEVGVGVVATPSWWTDVNIGGVLTAKVDTPDGLATIIGVKDGEVEQPATWSFGVTLSLLYLPPRGPLPPEIRDGRESRAAAAYAVCAPRCRASSISPDDAPFCKARKEAIEHNAGEVLARRTQADDQRDQPAAFCKKAQAALTEADRDLASGKIDDKQHTDAKRAAFKSCLDACGTADEDMSFCAPVELDPAAIGEGKTCALARETIYKPYYESHATSRDIPRLYPPLLLKAGAQVGHAEFTYRTADDGAPSRLVEKIDPVTPWSGGISVASIPSWGRYATTIEGLVAYSSSWKASKKTARWCSPVGDVARDEDERDPADPAESCQEATLNGPTNTKKFRIAAQAGIVDGYHGVWRLAAGPELSVPVEDAEEEFSLGLRFPFYVSFASAPEKLSYHGIVRVAPSISFTRMKDGTKDIGGFIELAILGQRSLFSDQFDAL